MSEHKKEDAKAVYIDICRHSWTFGRMTEEEKGRCEKIFSHDVAGTFGQRCQAYALIYSAFLIGLGYNGPFWREEAIT